MGSVSTVRVRSRVVRSELVVDWVPQPAVKVAVVDVQSGIRDAYDLAVPS